jgi:hypothetical protein
MMYVRPDPDDPSCQQIIVGDIDYQSFLTVIPMMGPNNEEVVILGILPIQYIHGGDPSGGAAITVRLDDLLKSLKISLAGIEQAIKKTEPEP